MPHSCPPNFESAAPCAAKAASIRGSELDEESHPHPARQELPPYCTARNREILEGKAEG